MKKFAIAVSALLLAVACLFAADAVKKAFYCKYCGFKSSSVASLTGSPCIRHPDGTGKGRHALYEGSEKSVYTCKFCGHKASDIRSLTGSKCMRHPTGAGKGWHEPAL